MTAFHTNRWAILTPGTPTPGPVQPSPAPATPTAAAGGAPARLSPQLDPTLSQALHANLAQPDGRAARQRRHCGALFSAFLRNLTSQGLAALAGLSVRACVHSALAALGARPAVAAGATALVALSPLLVHAAAGAQCGSRMAADQPDAARLCATRAGAVIAPLMLPLGLAIAAAAAQPQERLAAVIAGVALAVGRDAAHAVRELALVGYDMLTLRDREDGVGGRLARSRIVPWTGDREATHADPDFDRFERDQLLLQALAYGVMVSAIDAHLTPGLKGLLAGDEQAAQDFDHLFAQGQAGAVGSALAEALDGVLAGLCALVVANARFGGSATRELTFRWPQREGDPLPDWQARGATRITMNTVQDLGNGVAAAVQARGCGGWATAMAVGATACLVEGLVEGGLLRIAAADRAMGIPAFTDLQEAPRPPVPRHGVADVVMVDLVAEAAALLDRPLVHVGETSERKRGSRRNAESRPRTAPLAPHATPGRKRRVVEMAPSKLTATQRANLVGRQVLVANAAPALRDECVAARMTITGYDTQNDEFVVSLQPPVRAALKAYLKGRPAGADGKGGQVPFDGRTRFQVGELMVLPPGRRGGRLTSPSASPAAGRPTGYGAGTPATR